MNIFLMKKALDIRPFCDELADAQTEYITTLVTLADKYNLNRDAVIELNNHTMKLMSETGTFKNFK